MRYGECAVARGDPRALRRAARPRSRKCDLALLRSGDLPPIEVRELLRTIELAYGVSAGLLRPNDPLDHLTAPIPVRNPLTDAFYRFWMDESWGEINCELGKRLHRRRQSSFPAEALRSLSDLAWAWCGRLGANGERLVSAT